MTFKATCITVALTSALANVPVWSNDKPVAESDSVAAAGTQDNAKDSAKDKKWDVNNPPGEQKIITINTTETTWSNVDVSPDGKTVIFDMLGDIYAMPIDGGKAKPLTQGLSWAMQPRFSPDGKQIAYISDESGADNLWVMNADGTEPKQVSKEKVNLVHNPNWSPDGEYIAVKKGFVSARSIAAGEIWMYHKAGGNGLQIKKRIGGEQAQKTIAEPAFTPDGRYIYYSVDSTPGTVWQYNKNPTSEIFSIRRYDRETGKDIKLVGGPGGAIAPTPSSNGKHLAFVRRVDEKTVLFVKDLKTGLEKPLFDGLDRDLQETNGSQGNFTHFGWTPDNRSLVIWAGGKIHKVDAKSGQHKTLPMEIQVEKKITNALRFNVDVAPESFDVKMIRWAQKSPDGEKIAYQALGKIYIRDIDSGKRERLTSQNDHFEYFPTFSRDGESIAYVTWDDKKLGSVRVADADGGSGDVITTEPGHYVEPDFSPDGESVVFRRFTGGYLTSPENSMEPGIYIADADGDGMRRVHDSGYRPHFGADPKRIYFTNFGWGKGASLHSVDLAGKEVRDHYTSNDIVEYRVSPNGKWVAFLEQFDAYVAPFIKTGKSESMGSTTSSVQVKRLSKRSGEYLHWSKNSKQVSWAHGATLFTRDLKDAYDYMPGAPEELPEPATAGIDLGFKVKADIPKGRIALVGAKIVTMKDADSTQEVIDNGVVIVNGNRIEAVGKNGDVQIPSGTQVVDVEGKTIIPGMVDVHAHGSQGMNEIIPEQNWSNYSSLGFGVTTIHDPSNDSSEIFAASEMQRKGSIVGPRIYSTGTILYGAKAPGYRAKINGYDDAKFHVQRLKDLGAISVKSYNQPRRDQRQQVIAAGNELGIMVVPEGGAKFYANMTQVIDGHTGIEHALPISKGYDDVKQLWSQTESGYSPTFGVAYGGLSGETYWYDRTNVWENERLLRWTPKFLVEPQAIRRTTAPDDHYNHIKVAKFAKELRDKGVRVVIGAHGQREGLAAHWEIWMMNQGGFTPWEALRGATYDGAKYLGMDKDIGSIEPGKLADMAIIDGDVLTDIKRSEFVAYTMINGRLFDAKSMNEVARKGHKREPFFFERLNLSGMPEATAKAVKEKQEKHHWRH
ncbi:amidohydrolase family protein [Pleionea sediminis]|uniref:amidohydrolase family protein n=1 Tax=Pleionea sediminis TaxID=2569479 RepID=UPI001185A50E|nr:amidohydrolase family protein [Pleionea sediminis]